MVDIRVKIVGEGAPMVRTMMFKGGLKLDALGYTFVYIYIYTYICLNVDVFFCMAV